MNKTILKFLVFIIAAIGLGFFVDWYAAVNIPGGTDIEGVSIDYNGGGDAVYAISNTGFRLLTTAKVFIQGVLIIMIVYTGFMMIMSMWNDEEKLSAAKRQIRYFLVAMLFVNIPGTIYEAFYKDSGTSVGWAITGGSFTSGAWNSNLFVDFFVFGNTLNDNIVGFLQVMIFILAVFMLVLAGINLITSRGREEKMSEAKTKVVYTILALIFVGIIEAWKNVAFEGDISDGVNLMESLANLALFFAGPVAIFFLTLAWYYYITANGDEERVKKAKNIIINTVLATLILLAAYTFLIDLATL